MWDLTLPGYKYLGPGNKLNKGKPRSKADAVAKAHDIEYEKLLQLGKNPYTNWNKADEKFMNNVNLNEYGGLAGYGFFGLKRAAHIAGLIGSVQNHKRLRTVPPTIKTRANLRGATAKEIESTSLTNLTSMAEANGGSGQDAGLKETQIDNPYVVYRGPPDYTFCSLPYSETRMNFYSNVSSADHIFRMTSVYDCRLESANVDINTGAGNQYVYEEAESSQRKARWFDFYSGLYNYYHVVGCQYNVFIENLCGEPMWVYQMFYNDEQPNVGATNQDMQLWPGVKYKYLDRRYLAIGSGGYMETGDLRLNEEINETTTTTQTTSSYEDGNHVSNNARSKCVFSGEYKTGDYKREIRLDSLVENWTAVTTNPGLPEKLLIRVKPVSDRVNLNSSTDAGDLMRYKIQVKLNYLVEFKELKASLRYPVQQQPLTVTIQDDIDVVG
jgi:hypothetical protein